VNVTLCPAVSWAGVDKPEILKPAPETAAWLKLSVDPPEFVRVSERLRLFPTCTLPKLKLTGFAVSAPGTFPVPLNGRPRLGLVASLVKVIFPLTVPLAFGAKVTEKPTLCPAPRLAGRLSPLML
jgi:hypothetical protein